MGPQRDPKAPLTTMGPQWDPTDHNGTPMGPQKDPIGPHKTA